MGLAQVRVEDPACWRIAAGPVHRGREATRSGVQRFGISKTTHPMIHAVSSRPEETTSTGVNEDRLGRARA